MQMDATQIVVAAIHAYSRSTSEHKGKQIAQIDLVIDGCDQQNHQGQQQHPTRTRGQDIDIALS